MQRSSFFFKTFIVSLDFFIFQSHEKTNLVHVLRTRLAEHYRSVLKCCSMDWMGDWEFMFRTLYTPCTLTDSTEWPPRAVNEPYDHYHKMFKQVILLGVSLNLIKAAEGVLI